jgi:hypothetical protein
MVDPTGFLLTTIRDFPTVAALTTRVRGGEPAPGDALGAGSYQRFVVLAQLGRLREKRVPVMEVRYVARCYGVDSPSAAVLAGAVSDAIHNRKARANAAGVLIWASFDDGGGDASRDPDTGQPMVPVIISITAATVPMT